MGSKNKKAVAFGVARGIKKALLGEAAVRRQDIELRQQTLDSISARRRRQASTGPTTPTPPTVSKAEQQRLREAVTSVGRVDSFDALAVVEEEIQTRSLDEKFFTTQSRMPATIEKVDGMQVEVLPQQLDSDIEFPGDF